jgi:uncharacterized protein YajQ (UPF0234 family)
MADSSFDVVSEFDQQELVNALDQVRREIATRYDFKNSRCTLDLGKAEVTLHADDDFRAAAVKDLVQSKATKRGLSLKIFAWGRIEPAAGGTVRQVIGLKRGLTADQARELSKHKVSIQGDALRVISPKKDELQSVIADLRGLDYPVALQFTNYR